MESEYQTLRDEIGRLQNHATRMLEVGIILSTSIFTLSYSSLIGQDSQWIVLFSPTFLMIPLIYLILDRIRTTWVIGRYIEFFLEPKLDLNWESFNRYFRTGNNKRFSTRFSMATILPLIIIQVISSFLSIISGGTGIRQWVGMSIVTVTVLAIESSWIRRFSLKYTDILAIKNALINFDLNKRAKHILHNNSLGKATKPSPKQYPHQWNWDSAFIAIGISHFNAERAGEEIISLLRGQWQNGMIPHIIYSEADGYFPDRERWEIIRSKDAPTKVYTSGITQPPMITIAASEIAKSLGTDFAKAVYPSLLKYHEWWFSERDPQKEGLVSIIHPWESGTDNSPRWIKILDQIKLPYLPKYERKDQLHVSRKERPTDEDYNNFVYLMDLAREFNYDQGQILENSPFVVQDVLLNSFLHHANECLHDLAIISGNPTKKIDKWINSTRNAFEKKLWDSKAKMHCDFDVRNNIRIQENTIAIMAPLYAGLVDEEKARLIVEHHLLNPKEYAPDMDVTKYFVPTVSKSSKYFNPTRYWLGPIWVNMNWMVIRGLERYGFNDIAERIRDDTLELLEISGFHEYFNPSTGKGYGTNQFSWSAALAIDLISKE